MWHVTPSHPLRHRQFPRKTPSAPAVALGLKPHSPCPLHIRVVSFPIAFGHRICHPLPLRKREESVGLACVVLADGAAGLGGRRMVQTRPVQRSSRPLSWQRHRPWKMPIRSIVALALVVVAVANAAITATMFMTTPAHVTVQKAGASYDRSVAVKLSPQAERRYCTSVYSCTYLYMYLQGVYISGLVPTARS